ncbi:MAG: hypothetical protein JWO53_958, partial [Chlamydiia bacterium]|nr:hypothetical protein [Chlamydiia bacterium]
LSIWPVYKTMAHLDIATAGFIAIAAISMGEVSQLFFGNLIDKGYQKRLLIVGPLLASIAVLFPYVESYLLFFLLILCTCIGSAVFHPTAASILGGIVSPRKALFMGLFQMSGNFGMGIGQLFFSSTFKALDGSTIILILPAALLSLVVFLSPMKTVVSTNKTPISLRNVLRFFQIKPLRCLYFVQVCNQSLLWSLVFLLPDFLLSRGYSETIVFGGGHFMLLCGAALGCLPAGYLSDKYTPAKILFTGFLLAIGFLYFILGTPVLSSEVLFGALFCTGASLGCMTPVALVLGSELVPDQRGMVSAFLMGLVWIVSEGIGIGSSGVLVGLFSEDGPAKALAMIGLLLFVGTIFAYKLMSTEEQSSAAILIEEV